jgi:hypothetical protein
MEEHAINTIADDQNSDKQLLRLAAQKCLHSAEKRVAGLQFSVAVVFPIACFFAARLLPSLQAWAAFYGIAVALLDSALLDYFQAHFRGAAVAVQELFDSELYKLDWSPCHVGTAPDPESIHGYALKYKRRHPNMDDLRDWYPNVVSRLPLSWARLVCQRVNLEYDLNLRRQYAYILLSLLVALPVSALIVSIAKGMLVRELVVTIMAPALPLVQWCIREFKRHRNASMATSRIKAHVESLLSKAGLVEMTESKLAAEARSIQDAIAESRAAKPPVPDWFYRRHRKENEERMTKGTADVVDSVLTRLTND